MVFCRREPDLYVFDNSTKSTVTPYCFLNTEKERLNSLSRTRQRKVHEARRVYENIGLPTNRNFLHIVDYDIVQGLPIKRQAAKDFLYVYGFHEAALQGKTKRQTPPHNDSYNLIPVDPDILEHYHDVTICTDVFLLMVFFFC